MTEEKPTAPKLEPQKLELSAAQVAGSALAAVTAAFFASWAGTAGTIIGVALGSVIATAGAATYSWSLRRTSAVVRRTAAQVRETGMGSTIVLPKRSLRGPAEDDADDADEPDEPKESRWAFLRGRPWGKVLVAAVGVAVLSLGAVTAVEALAGKSFSSITRGDDEGSTTLSNVGGGGSSDTETPTPSPSPSSSATSDATDATTPTATPSATATDAATPSATATPTPTADPTATATDDGTGDSSDSGDSDSGAQGAEAVDPEATATGTAN